VPLEPGALRVGVPVFGDTDSRSHSKTGATVPEVSTVTCRP
jgi:hypothetical protein